MKEYFSRNKVFISAAVLLSTIATADNIVLKSNNAPTQASTPTYSASGTMSKKTAIMLTNLLRNPHLKVKAIAGKRNNHASTTTYTIKGKASRASVLKLQRLLQTNQDISMTISHQTNNIAPNWAKQRPVQQPFQNYTQFPGAYQPFYYNGRPPLFAQGNVVWVPVPVMQAMQMQQARMPSPLYPQKIASK